MLPETPCFAQYEIHTPSTRTVDTHVCNLRRKIEADAEAPRFLRTVHGVGYMLVTEPGA